MERGGRCYRVQREAQRSPAMKKDRKFKIDRRLLIAAAVIYSILMIIGFLHQYGQEGRSIQASLFILVMMSLPVLFLFAALRFPTMIYSTVLAGIGAFWPMCFVFFIPGALLFVQERGSHSSPFTIAGAVLETIGLILGLMSAAEAASWIRDLRDRIRDENAWEGIDRMTKGLTAFLRPRMPGALAFFIWGVLAVVVFFPFWKEISALSTFPPKNDYDVSALGISLLTFLLFPAVALLSALYMISEIRKYARYVNDLKDSGVFGQAALDYHKGKAYCQGRVILGSQYILVEGTDRLTEYSDIAKIRHDVKDGSRNRHWYLIASKKDGTEFRLVELPYAHKQKNYDKYVRPMLDEIGVIDPGIVIEEPGKFH